MPEENELRRRLRDWDDTTQVPDDEAERRLRVARRQALAEHRSVPRRTALVSRPVWAAVVLGALLVLAILLIPDRHAPDWQPPNWQPRDDSSPILAEAKAGTEPIRSVLVSSNGTRIYWSTTP